MNRRVRFLISALSALAMVTLVVSIAAAAPVPFIGAWESIDTDGSDQILTIGGGAGDTYHVRYYDFGATTCGLDPVSGDFLYAASARGTLAAGGSDLTGTLPLYCQTSPPTHHSTPQFAYTYQPATDTLIDIWGVVWNRK